MFLIKLTKYSYSTTGTAPNLAGVYRCTNTVLPLPDSHHPSNCTCWSNIGIVVDLEKLHYKMFLIKLAKYSYSTTGTEQNLVGLQPWHSTTMVESQLSMESCMSEDFFNVT